MTETVKIWIDEFKARDKDFNEEIEDIKGTIANERLWQKGVETKEQVDMHEENIAELTEYLEWLEENKDKKPFYVTLKVEGYYETEVYANNLEEAKEEAIFNFEGADFGELKDIDAEYSHAEDKAGNFIDEDKEDYDR